MCVAAVLDRIKEINRADAQAVAEFGELKLGPRDALIDELPCVDGVSVVTASEQVREFYRYALWWRHCSVEFEWCDPREAATLLTIPAVRATIDADLRNPPMAGANTVLFGLDNRESPYERVYLVYSGTSEPKEPMVSEPRVLQAGSEISVFDDLVGYLRSFQSELE